MNEHNVNGMKNTVCLLKTRLTTEDQCHREVSAVGFLFIENNNLA